VTRRSTPSTGTLSTESAPPSTLRRAADFEDSRPLSCARSITLTPSPIPRWTTRGPGGFAGFAGCVTGGTFGGGEFLYLPQPPVRYPTLGSLVAKELGDPASELPSFVSISPYRNFNPAAFGPGFLGSQYAPLFVGEARNQNAGQDNAIMAGLRQSRGEYVVIMDDDLQHSPSDIPRLYEKCREGYDICYASFHRKQQALWKRLLSSSAISPMPLWRVPKLGSFSLPPRI